VRSVPTRGPRSGSFSRSRSAGTSGVPELETLPVGLAGFLFATTPSRVRSFALGAILLVELGLTLAGLQSSGGLLVHLLLYGLSCFAFSRLGSYQRWMVERAQARARAVADAEVRTRAAEDFGVHTRQAEALPRMPSLDEPTGTHLGGRQALDFVEQSVSLQLDILRDSLDLGTAAVLWHNRELAELHLRGLSTRRPDVRQGPFAPGVGIPATLLREEVREMQVAPVRAGYPMLPYYGEGAVVGGLFAVAIPIASGQPRRRTRASTASSASIATRRIVFTDAERAVVRQTARKIALDVACGRVLKQSEHDRATMSRFVVVLRELNAQLGLDGVARAATKAVKTLFAVDLVAISLFDRES
jgi:hypothetical protein